MHLAVALADIGAQLGVRVGVEAMQIAVAQRAVQLVDRQRLGDRVGPPAEDLGGLHVARSVLGALLVQRVVADTSEGLDGRQTVVVVLHPDERPVVPAPEVEQDVAAEQVGIYPGVIASDDSTTLGLDDLGDGEVSVLETLGDVSADDIAQTLVGLFPDAQGALRRYLEDWASLSRVAR